MAGPSKIYQELAELAEKRMADEAEQLKWVIHDQMGEIARLTEEVNYWKIADNHHQELMAEKEAEIAGLQDRLGQAECRIATDQRLIAALANKKYTNDMAV